MSMGMGEEAGGGVATALIGLVGAVVGAGSELGSKAITANAQKSAAKTAAKAAIQQQQILGQTEIALSEQNRALLVQAGPLILGAVVLAALAYVLGGRGQ